MRTQDSGKILICPILLSLRAIHISRIIGYVREWKHGSEVKSTYCPCRGVEFSSQHSHDGTHNYLKLQFQRIQYHLLASGVLKHTSDTHPYVKKYIHKHQT